MTKRHEQMNQGLYVKSWGYLDTWDDESGDQTLIMADIAACLYAAWKIYFPYPCERLAEHLEILHGKEIVDAITDAEGVYWGTPTIVDNRPLFEKSLRQGDSVDLWTKENERAYSRVWAKAAEMIPTMRVIVTGLGSGDITVKERLEDMGGGHVVSHKIFHGFEDWVLMRTL